MRSGSSLSLSLPVQSWATEDEIIEEADLPQDALSSQAARADHICVRSSRIGVAPQDYNTPLAAIGIVRVPLNPIRHILTLAGWLRCMCFPDATEPFPTCSASD